MIRLPVDPTDPDPAAVAQAVGVIRAGGIVALPTDTLYGLAADPRRGAAIRRIFTLKGRATDQALLLVAADLVQLETALGPLPASARLLADRFWPGPLTLIVPSSEALVPLVTAGRATVGIRVPAHEVPRAVCRAVGWPLTATSANVSGAPAPDDPEEVAGAFGDTIEILLDAGRVPGGPPSTIVDTLGERPRLLRAGAIPWEVVLRCLHA